MPFSDYLTRPSLKSFYPLHNPPSSKNVWREKVMQVTHTDYHCYALVLKSIVGA